MQPDNWALAIDVGGTKTALAAIAFAGADDAPPVVLRRMSLPTPALGDGGLSLERVLAAATALFRAAETDCSGSSQRFCGIGLSLCELIDPEGRIASAATVPWLGLPVAEKLGALGPLTIGSDVRLAALAESRFGAGRGLADFLYVNVGTGISSCFVIGGVPWAGHRGNAILLGSSELGRTAGPETAEQAGSGGGLAARYAAGGGDPSASGRQVLEQAEQGDPLASAVVDAGADALGLALAFAINLLDPSAVILGGSVVTGEGRYWQILQDATRRRIYAPATRTLPIRRAKFTSDAALIGAAWQALKAYQTTEKPGGSER